MCIVEGCRAPAESTCTDNAVLETAVTFLVEKSAVVSSVLLLVS